nr:unnamed protein product [Callosobruchus chinensis]
MRRRSTRTRASEKQASSEAHQSARKEQSNSSAVESDTKPNENNKNSQEVSEEAVSTTPTGTPTKSRRRRPLLWKPNKEDESTDTQNNTNQDIITSETDQLIVTDQVHNQGDFQNSSEQNIQDGLDEGKLNESNIQNNGTSVDQNETENDNVQGTTDSPHKDTKYPDANDVQQCNENETSKDDEANIVVESESDNFQSEYSIEKSDKVDEESKNEKPEDDKKDKTQPPTANDNKSIKLPPKKITLKRLQSKVTLDDKQPENKQRSGSADNNSVRENSSEMTVGKEEVSSTDQDKTLKRRHSDTRPEDKEEKIRRSSVTSCENKNELEAKVLKHHPKIRLIRLRSDENASGDTSILPKRKKPSHWGCSSSWFSNLNASLYKLDVDTLKIVCPTIEFLNEDEVKLDSTPKEKERRGHEKRVETKIVNEDVPEIGNQEESDAATSNLFTHNRKVSIIGAVQDSGQIVQNSNQAMSIGGTPREPSPASHAVSQVLYITNLVRPFTVKQLKDLLQRTGKIVDDGFWTDKIKSKCYVQYETEEEAVATRNALHGINWPISNGKKLKIDYATVEDLEKAKNPVPATIAKPDVTNEKENKLKITKANEEKEDMKKRDFVRDWDQNKEDLHKRSRSRSRERVRKHSRRSYTPEGYPKKHKKHEEAVPQKLMDDLFLKTKTTPSIYWQPLSPEEIAKKQHQRLVCMEEYKRRIEEKRERNRENRHGPYRRR